MSARLARERARSVVATPQAKLKDARRALRAAVTLIRDASSLGCMADEERARLAAICGRILTNSETLQFVEAAIGEFQSSLRARRSRKAA